MARAQAKPAALSLLVTVVGRGKAEFYADTLSQAGANVQMLCAARGTTPAEAKGAGAVADILGYSQVGKTVIFSIIRKDRTGEIMKILDEKFSSVKNGKGIAYTVPLSSVIGAQIYSFLLGGTR